MNLKHPKTFRECEEKLQPQMAELQFLNCTPEKACNFIFSTETPSKNMAFEKTLQVKITSESKVMPVFVI